MQIMKERSRPSAVYSLLYLRRRCKFLLLITVFVTDKEGEVPLQNIFESIADLLFAIVQELHQLYGN